MLPMILQEQDSEGSGEAERPGLRSTRTKCLRDPDVPDQMRRSNLLLDDLSNIARGGTKKISKWLEFMVPIKPA